MTWEGGMNYCNNLGMQSVSIHPEEKLQLLISVMQKLNGKRLFNESILIPGSTSIDKKYSYFRLFPVKLAH